jgi:integrase
VAVPRFELTPALEAEHDWIVGLAVLRDRRVELRQPLQTRELVQHEPVIRIAPLMVFGNRSGKSLRESKLLRNLLQPAAQKAGLGRVTWHQFRHIHSSLLNDLKVPVKIAQEQLGHASISTTLNFYTHVVDASHRKAAKRSKSGCLARWTVLD